MFSFLTQTLYNGVRGSLCFCVPSSSLPKRPVFFFLDDYLWPLEIKFSPTPLRVEESTDDYSVQTFEPRFQITE